MRTRSLAPPRLTRGIIRSVWLLNAAPSAGAGAAVQVPTQCMVSLMAVDTSLALDGAGRETGDVVLHEERIDEGDGNGAQQRPGHQLAPVEGIATDQLAHDADRHGAHARFAEKEEGVEELVLRQR